MKKQATHLSALMVKYADNYKKFNKIAGGNGLKYITLEFENLESEINEIVSHYRKSLNSKSGIDKDLVNVCGKILTMKFNLLGEFYTKYSDMFSAFTKKVESRHKKELINQLGQDYALYLDKFVDNPDSAFNLSTGLFAKYKLILQMFEGQDKELIIRVMKFIDHEANIILTKTQRQKDQLEKISSSKFDGGDYSWLSKYTDLFKFASKDGDDDGEYIELTEEDFDYSPVVLKLLPVETNALRNIVDMWQKYKASIMNPKYENYLNTLFSNANAVLKSNEVSGLAQAERFESVFEELKSVKYMIKSFIADGGSEKEFYDNTHLTFRNAFIKIDKWVYLLSTLMPTVAKAYKFVNKMPSKPDDKSVTPYDLDSEQDFFDQGADYESGNRDEHKVYQNNPFESSLPFNHIKR